MAFDACTEDLRDASFRGVPFMVDNDDITYGRRIITHEYPLRDDPDHEDFGEKPREFTVKGYVYGGDAIEQKDAVVAAARAYGPALLVLPAEMPLMVRCLSLAVARSKDKQGWFDLTFKFRAENNGGLESDFIDGEIELLVIDACSGLQTALTTIASLAQQVDNILDSVDIAFATMSGFVDDVSSSPDLVDSGLGLFGLTLSLDSALQYVTDNAVFRMQTFASDLANAVEANPLTVSDGGSALTLTATQLYNDADDYAKDLTTALPVIGSLLSGLCDAMAADDALVALKPFLSFAVAEQDYDPSIALSRSERVDARQAEFFNCSVRSLALGAYATAITRTTFSTRAEAVTMRGNVVDLFNQEIERLSFNEDAVVALTEIRDQCVKYISANIVNAVPTIEISAPASMPALYWAYRLYGDPTRAQEIVDRNGIVDPAFVPSQFEALAR
jgi:hypothetical protein